MQDLLILSAMFSMSVISGMLGIGVAFAAIPILSFGNMSLVNEVQPIALFLNGVTALFSAVAFARAGYVDWRKSVQLAAVATAFSPLGAVAALYTSEPVLWGCYFVAVGAILFFMLQKQAAARERLAFSQVLALSAPIAALSGLLGVGAGFLLVPLMIFSGVTAHRAAAMNSVAVVPASFASLAPHIASATVNVSSALPIVICAAVGAFLGGFLATRAVSERGLRRVFLVVMVALAGYKVITLADHGLQSAAATDSCASAGLVFVNTEMPPCP
jgi:uncharacterized membrane protein YfcA